MSAIARTIRVFGKVQNVWFRKFTQEKALEIGLTGTVQNLPDGSVLIQAFGTDDQLNRFQDWCWQGSPQSAVEKVEVSSSEVRPGSGFQIINT